MAEMLSAYTAINHCAAAMIDMPAEHNIWSLPILYPIKMTITVTVSL
jgi:hypothetical protein